MIITRGHFRAEIDAQDLDDVQVNITMSCAMDTCEAMLGQAESQLEGELSALRYMIHDYVSYLYELREEGFAYAV